MKPITGTTAIVSWTRSDGVRTQEHALRETQLGAEATACGITVGTRWQQQLRRGHGLVECARCRHRMALEAGRGKVWAPAKVPITPDVLENARREFLANGGQIRQVRADGTLVKGTR